MAKRGVERTGGGNMNATPGRKRGNTPDCQPEGIRKTVVREPDHGSIR